jgi:hypothetical protein
MTMGVGEKARGNIILDDIKRGIVNENADDCSVRVE